MRLRSKSLGRSAPRSKPTTMDNKQTMRYFRMRVGVSLTDDEANSILGVSYKQAGAILGKLMQERGFCVDGYGYIPEG